MTAMQVPGYDVVELLGYGSGGEVWLARERATGRPVALKRLRPGADLAARDRLRREAAVLAGVDHPHVVRLRGVHGDGEAIVLVLDLAQGGSLARLLATRRRLAPGEVVTIAVPLAQALAAVHTQGLVHGDVTPANVLFGADGRPLLSDLGVSRLLGSSAGDVGGTRGFLDPAVAAGAAPDAASDVHGLAATCVAALTGRAPYDEQGRRVAAPDDISPALLGVLEPALALDPAARPTAESFAVAVFDAVAAEPVRFDPSVEAPVGVPPSDARLAAPTHRVRPAAAPAPLPVASTGSGGRWRRKRILLTAAAAGLGVALAVAAGVAWAGADDQPPAGATATRPVDRPSSAPDWAGVLSALDRARSHAYAAGDAEALRAVYAPGAPAWPRDSVVLGRLVEAGLRAEQVRLDATSVAVDGRAAGRVRLDVTDVMPPYRVVDSAGAVVDQRPGRGARSWTVVLARDRGRWKVYDVLRG